MVTFSRNSWHYKFMKFAASNPWSVRDREHNFCQYWRYFTLMCGKVGGLAIVAWFAFQGMIYSLMCFGYSLFSGAPFLFPFDAKFSSFNFYNVYWSLSMMLGFFGDVSLGAVMIVGIFYCMYLMKEWYFEKYPRKKKPKVTKTKTDSLFAAKMKAAHNKICPQVTWVGDQVTDQQQ